MPLLSFVHANTSRQLLVTARENASFSGQKAKARQKKREREKVRKQEREKGREQEREEIKYTVRF